MQPESARALSIEEETTLGQEFFSQVNRYFNLVEDDFLTEYLNSLGLYLVRSIEAPPFPFKFHLIKDGSLNAFAGPGGYVFMFTGLVMEMDRVDELAAVVCHEIAHVSSRHLSTRIEQGKKIGLATLAGILAGVLIGGPAAGAIVSGTMAAGIQTQLYYSRNDEREADQRGFLYMKNAGFDPRAMVSVLSKIERGRWMGTDKVPAYLLTHPTGPERMANLDIITREYTEGPLPPEAHFFASEYPFFRATVVAMNMDSNDAARVFKSEIKGNPKSAVGYFGLGLVMKGKADFDMASEYLARASRIAPESAVVLRSLADTYQASGRVNEAISVLERVLEKDRNDKAALFLLAGCHQYLGNDAKAVSIYEKLVSFPPVKDDVFHNLGVSYGRLEKLSLAHLNFGIFFKKKGESSKARFHFEKAMELAAGDNEMADRIKKAMESGPRPKRQQSR